MHPDYNYTIHVIQVLECPIERVKNADKMADDDEVYDCEETGTGGESDETFYSEHMVDVY